MKAAEELQPGERFDLVIDSTYSSIAVVQSDAELSEAVRRKKPRAMIVKDVAEQISEAVENFEYHANEGSVPTKKGPGRPRSAERGLRLVDSGAGG